MQFDPRAADRLHRMTLVAQDIASRPNLGPYEVGVMEQLMEEAERISGTRADRERMEAARRYRLGRGRAVDIPPQDRLTEWLRNHLT